MTDHRPLWEELSEAADELAIAGKVDKQTLKLLRASVIQMENWFTGCQELREEKDEAMKRVDEQDSALNALADVFFHAAKFARHEMTIDAFGTCVIDKVPFLNAMAAHGLDSIGAPLQEKRKRAKK
jgi:hypothetical protein